MISIYFQLDIPRDEFSWNHGANHCSHFLPTPINRMFSFRIELDHNQVGVASLLPLATIEGAETWDAAIIAYICCK